MRGVSGLFVGFLQGPPSLRLASSSNCFLRILAGLVFLRRGFGMNGSSQHGMGHPSLSFAFAMTADQLDTMRVHSDHC